MGPRGEAEDAVRGCGSKMCSGQHRTVFGRCYCARPKGHVGPHFCALTLPQAYEDFCADIERAGLDGHPMLVHQFRAASEGHHS